jgi:hypothetical protein
VYGVCTNQCIPCYALLECTTAAYCSCASCITYIDNSIVFVGSTFGDSQLIKLSETVTEDGSHIEVTHQSTDILTYCIACMCVYSIAHVCDHQQLVIKYSRSCWCHVLLFDIAVECHAMLLCLSIHANAIVLLLIQQGTLSCCVAMLITRAGTAVPVYALTCYV